MRIRALLVPAVLALGGALIVPAAAYADPYPAGDPDVTVPTATVADEGSLELTGTGYGANETVEIDVTYAEALGRPANGGFVSAAFTRLTVVKTVDADADGNWTTSITLTQVGVATVTATGTETGVSQTVTVTVLSDLPLSDDEDGLPITGSRLTVAILLGTVTVVAGAILLWVPIALRRRARHTSGDV